MMEILTFSLAIMLVFLADLAEPAPFPVKDNPGYVNVPNQAPKRPANSPASSPPDEKRLGGVRPESRRPNGEQYKSCSYGRGDEDDTRRERLKDLAMRCHNTCQCLPDGNVWRCGDPKMKVDWADDMRRDTRVWGSGGELCIGYELQVPVTCKCIKDYKIYHWIYPDLGKPNKDQENSLQLVAGQGLGESSIQSLHHNRPQLPAGSDSGQSSSQGTQQYKAQCGGLYNNHKNIYETVQLCSRCECPDRYGIQSCPMDTQTQLQKLWPGKFTGLTFHEISKKVLDICKDKVKGVDVRCICDKPSADPDNPRPDLFYMPLAKLDTLEVKWTFPNAIPGFFYAGGRVTGDMSAGIPVPEQLLHLYNELNELPEGHLWHDPPPLCRGPGKPSKQIDYTILCISGCRCEWNRVLGGTTPKMVCGGEGAQTNIDVCSGKMQSSKPVNCNCLYDPPGLDRLETGTKPPKSGGGGTSGSGSGSGASKGSSSGSGSGSSASKGSSSGSSKPGGGSTGGTWKALGPSGGSRSLD